MRERERKRKSFLRKIVRGLILVFLFTGLFVLGTGVFSYRDSRNRFLGQNQNQLESLSATLASQIHMAFGGGASFFQEPYVIMYLKPENQRTIQDHSEIWRVVQLIAKSESTLSPLVVNEFAFYPEDGNVAAGAGTYEKDFFFSEICRYGDYDRDFWQTHFTGPGRYVLPETTVTGKGGSKRVLPLVTVIKRFGSLAFYVTNVSGDYLNQIIMSSNAYLDEYYLFDESDRLLLASPTRAHRDNIPAEGEGELMKRRGLFIFRASNELTGWTFYGLLTGRNFLSVFRHILGVGGFLMIIMLAGEIVLIGVLSRDMYNPIRDMQNLLSSPDSRQRKDEIDFIKESIRELMDRETRREKKEKDLVLSTNSQSLVMLMNGMEMPERLPSLAAYLREDFRFSGDSYLCATLVVHPENRKGDLLRPDEIGKLIDYEGGFIVVALGRYLFGIIYSVDGGIPCAEGIRRSLAPLGQGLPGREGTNRIAVGIGSPAAGMESLALSHRQAAAALPFLRKEALLSLRFYDDLPPNRKVSFTFYDQKGILNNLETGQEVLLEGYLIALIEKNEKQGIESDQLAEFFRQILLIGRRALEEHGKEAGDIELYGYLYGKLSEEPDMLSLRYLSAQVIKCLLEIQRMCCGEEARNSSGRMEEIREYIAQHYGEPLSLISIADHFHITAKYLSRLFKEETGIKLSEYLARIRMEKAKTLLCDSHIRIGEIASLVGIDSSATFLRLFHKYEGLSPKEFRIHNLSHQEIVYESNVI